ncbi:hypothetical protein ABNQ39_26720 [Azospirillum sp. A26]|uniref:hypothetical protein n=1 Tax=Azospirillum sp. A26 TaxID=3160607 RepID=UPI00366E7189
MMDVTSYIDQLELPAASPRAEAVSRDEPTAAFTAASQALVVGSQMAEFSGTVPRSVRPAISNGLLLGHLAARKATAGRDDPWAWYREYCTVMEKIGWLPTGAQQTQHDVDGRNASVHEAIIPVLMAAFGPAAAASSIILKVLGQLQTMDKDQPWLTLFEHRSLNVKAAKFTMNYIDGKDDEGVSLTTAFFSLEASKTLDQVLFFKFSEEKATLRSAQVDGVISAGTIAQTESALSRKVQPYIVDNIRNIEI